MVAVPEYEIEAIKADITTLKNEVLRLSHLAEDQKNELIVLKKRFEQHIESFLAHGGRK